MNVPFRILRRFVLDDVRQFGDVQPAGGNVGGDEETQRALAHPIQHPFAVDLREVGAQFVGVVAKALQHHRNKMHVDLGVAEDDRRCRVLNLDDANQAAFAPHVRHNVENVLGLSDVHMPAAEGDKLRLVHELMRGAHHLRREGGGEHTGIDAAVGQVALDFAHVRVEAHRQHAVGLVEDQDLQLVEHQRAFEQMVKDATGRADDDVRPLLERVDLAAIADAAVDGHGAQPRLTADRLRLVPHLAGQLACGDQDQRLAAVFLGVKPFDQRQQKGPGLAGAGARLDHHVAPGQEVGDAARLHGHQAGPAGAFDRCAQRRGQLLDGHIGQRVGGFFRFGV